MVYLFLADGFEESEALVTADLLRRAGIPLKLCGVTGPSVTGSHGITVQADCALDAAEGDAGLEAIVLPGGMPGTTNLWASKRLRALISRAASEQKLLCAICAAPLILGRLGLLEGRHAVCYPGFENELRGALLVPDDVSVDRRVVTSKAAGCVFGFGLKIIELLRGAKESDAVRQSVFYDADHGKKLI